jgi:hypothetical protein
MRHRSVAGISNLSLIGGVLLALVVAWIAFRVLFGTLMVAAKLGFAIFLVVAIAYLILNMGRGRGAAGR